MNIFPVPLHDKPWYILQLAIAALVFLYATYRRVRTRESTTIKLLRHPPDAEFIWGHERKVHNQQPGQQYRAWINKMGLAYRIKGVLWAPDILVLSDPEGIAHILRKKVYNYHHSPVVRPRVARLLGKGLGWVEGALEHKRMKRLVNPPFSNESIRCMATEIVEASSEVLTELKELVKTRENQASINILDWTAKATLTAIGRAVFLHDFQGGNSPEAVSILTKRRQGITPAAKYAGFLTLMLLRRFPILNKLPIQSIQSQALAKEAIQSGVAKEMVARNKSVYDSRPNGDREDLLTTLIGAHGRGTISMNELYDHISTFVMSGHETTTMTLGYSIWELSKSKPIQERLRDELQRLGRQPTYDDFSVGLPYLDAVLRETLRLYPGLPYMERIATVHDVIPLGYPVEGKDGKPLKEIAVRPGQIVIIPIMSIHRLDSVWKDPDTFRPERWLEELPPQDSLCSGWSNLLAFSDGPRACIGSKLAIFQYKVILSQIITSFNFDSTGDSLSLRMSSSLQAWVIGKEAAGPQLPVYIELLN